MRALVARDLADAAIPGLSADRRFATAYNAALQVASMAVACAGYRVTAKTGHHRVTLEAAVLALGSRAQRHADYLETCRRKRNVIDYTRSHVATETGSWGDSRTGDQLPRDGRSLDQLGLPRLRPQLTFPAQRSAPTGTPAPYRVAT
jgi:hypothetical protein